MIMSPIVPLVPADIAGLREEADLVQKLVASGAITDTERKQLLDEFFAEHQADRESSARRAQLSTATDQEIGDDIMTANEIVTQIEHTRSVISAQIRKLNELTPAPLHIPATEAGGSSGLVDLLHATVAAHMTNAADSLRAIAEVEAAMRAPACKPAVTEPSSAPASPPTIDAELGG
jgi:polyhydroxyalkanoate synthesis regulator phasin